jgi:MFS family permease
MGSASLYIVPTMVLSKFFHKKRGSTVGWSSVGVSAGQALIIPQLARIIPLWGWRSSMLLLGLLVIFSTSLIGFLFLRESPEELGMYPDGAKEPPSRMVEGEMYKDWTPKMATDTSSFRLVALSYFFAVGCIISMLTFVVPHMINIGIPPIQASGAFGVIGIMSAIGSFLFGIFSDRYGRKRTIIITTGLIAVAFMVATIIPANINLLYAWAVLYGLSYGGAPEQYAAIVTDYFGTTHNTVLFGLVTLVGGIGGGLLPLIGGWIVDKTGNYYATLLFLGVGMGLASLLALFFEEP